MRVLNHAVDEAEKEVATKLEAGGSKVVLIQYAKEEV